MLGRLLYLLIKDCALLVAIFGAVAVIGVMSDDKANRDVLDGCLVYCLLIWGVAHIRISWKLHKREF